MCGIGKYAYPGYICRLPGTLGGQVLSWKQEGFFMERLIIEEDTVYEIDEECLCQREEQDVLPETKEKEQRRRRKDKTEE